MPYQAAIGHNNAAGLTTLSPQPSSPNGVQTARYSNSASGQTYPDGEQFIELVYTSLEPAQKNALDTAFGVSDSVGSNEITVRIRKNDDSFANYNAIVDYPPVGRKARRSLNGWESVSYTVHLVEAL
jgi:hypothetical protein